MDRSTKRDPRSRCIGRPYGKDRRTEEWVGGGVGFVKSKQWTIVRDSEQRNYLQRSTGNGPGHLVDLLFDGVVTNAKGWRRTKARNKISEEPK